MTVVSADGLAVGRVSQCSSDGVVIDGSGILHGQHTLGMGEIAGVFAGEVFLRKRAADVADAPEAPAPAP